MLHGNRLRTFLLGIALASSWMTGAYGQQAYPTDRVVGAADAPVTMIEYASLGCIHCRNFHFDTLPTLMERYVETGQLRLIYRHFPIGYRAEQATALALCVPQERHDRVVDYLFRRQSDWSSGSLSLRRIARFAGVSDVDACFDDTAISQARQLKSQGAQDFQVESTPIFIFNNGERRILGARSLATFTQVIDELIEQAS